MKAGFENPWVGRVLWGKGDQGGHITVLEVDCDTQTHSSLVISSLPSLPLLGQKAHRAELLSSSSHQFRAAGN